MASLHPESPGIEKVDEPAAHLERASSSTGFNDDDEVPELHFKTWLALASCFLLNFTQVFALTGPPFILAYAGADLNATAQQTWIPNALSLLQAVGGPIISFGSDTFQARRALLFYPLLLAIVGSAICPGATSLGRIVAGQCLIGVEMATVPLAYAVPSELLPRRWRPMAQAAMNVAAGMAAIITPFIGAGFIKQYGPTGWRYIYWVQTGLFAVTAVFMFFGYNPPRRKSIVDGLTLSEKIARLDIPGTVLFTAALVLFLVGMGFGGAPYAWTDAMVLGPLISGLALLVAFLVYEWKGTSTGILHHRLFEQGRNFPILIACMFIEGTVLFSWIVFFPAITQALFTTDIMEAALRVMPYYTVVVPATVVYGLVSSKTRRIREPLAVGFLLWACGCIGMATIQPGQASNALGYDALAGAGFAAPLILIIAFCQLSIPHELLATGTAVLTSTRAVAATVATAFYAAALNQKLAVLIPERVAGAALANGLPPTSLPGFIGALAGNLPDQLATVPGVTPSIIGAGVAALQTALADGFRTIWIIASVFAAAGLVLTLCLRNPNTMNYHVDAPIEDVSRHHAGTPSTTAHLEKHAA